MEGVGAQLGRSSTRYGPTTVFTGPVRRWKKKWVHVSPPNNHSQKNETSINGEDNGNNGSHLLFYKWTASSHSQNNNNGDAGDNSSVKEDAVVPPEEPPRRKFKYIPIALLEEEAEENDTENVEDESKPSDSDANLAESAPKIDDFDEKPDMNDLAMDENQEDNKTVRQDLNENTLDLSLGLTAQDGDSDSNVDQSGKEELERLNSI